MDLQDGALFRRADHGDPEQGPGLQVEGRSCLLTNGFSDGALRRIHPTQVDNTQQIRWQPLDHLPDRPLWRIRIADPKRRLLQNGAPGRGFKQSAVEWATDVEAEIDNQRGIAAPGTINPPQSLLFSIERFCIARLRAGDELLRGENGGGMVGCPAVSPVGEGQLDVVTPTGDRIPYIDSLHLALPQQMLLAMLRSISLVTRNYGCVTYLEVTNP